jgi:putative photosynthetic complex assembly protein 2
MAGSPWIAALGALFVWWFTTGAILLVVRRADAAGSAAMRRAVVLGLPVLALGWLGLFRTFDDPSTQGVVLAFLSALAVWGWIELAFLGGVVTGPNRHVCPPRIAEWERFIRAWGTIAYHEMALVGALIVMGLAGAGSENAFGIWTFAVLFFARISAKLNLFLGVPKINTEFLPSGLAHLPSHFHTANMNWLFPYSVTALTFAVTCWIERLYAATTPGAVTGFALLAALTGLALLEHWFMVAKLPDEKLWRWMLPAPKTDTNDQTDYAK